MTVPDWVLDLLVCPQCRQKVHLNEAGDGLICQTCGLLYEIRDDIPIMLPDKAKKIPAASCPASQ
jgi:uncharacterized protein YbaR (Trm112 family)